MDLCLTPEQEAFRDEARAWLAANDPGETPVTEADQFTWRRHWQRRLHKAGLVAVSWPTEHGGRGADNVQQALLEEEMLRASAPRMINDVGLLLAGPMIIAHGTAAQKERYLGRIVTSDEIWCQGFSEPGAGSDLAALTTRATAVAGGWEVSGQKIWTSYAQHSRRCLLLARTGEPAQRHRSLTLFLVDMQAPGIETRPLRQITGDSEFNELFLDSVHISDDDVLGDVGSGWAVAMHTLQQERAMHSETIRVRAQFATLVAACRSRGLLGDPLLRQRLAQLYVELEGVRLNGLRMLTPRPGAVAVGPEAELHKWQLAETSLSLAELAADALGFPSLESNSPWNDEFLRARGLSIASGTNEILQNVIATRILGLPR
jgi:alkylation response protein AidB-like acyl-CoA dehydrogenase